MSLQGKRRGGSAPVVPGIGTPGAIYPLFRSLRPINWDVRRTDLVWKAASEKIGTPEGSAVVEDDGDAEVDVFGLAVV